MFIVVSESAESVTFIAKEELLRHILGHSNFDDENWDVGDLVILKDGQTASLVVHEDADPDALFYDYEIHATPREFPEILQSIDRYYQHEDFKSEEIEDCSQLFAHFIGMAAHATAKGEAFGRQLEKGCFLVFAAVLIAIAVLLWFFR